MVAEPLEFRPLRRHDVSAACRLSDQAGWNQLEIDWLRLLALWPETCVGAWRDAVLVATGTLAVYGADVTWIGMVLVDEALRGRGIGGAVFAHMFDLCDRVGVKVVGLDATDMGRAVYLKQRFVDHSRIERWAGGRPAGAAGPGPCSRPLEERDWSDVAALDRACVGVDRGPLLRRLAAEPGAQARAVVEDGRLIGIGFSRPGSRAAMLGPIVSPSLSAARTLAIDLLAGLPAGETFVDVPACSGLQPTLRELGFEPRRRLTRMARPQIDGPLLTGPAVHAAAGFELG